MSAHVILKFIRGSCMRHWGIIESIEPIDEKSYMQGLSSIL